MSPPDQKMPRTIVAVAFIHSAPTHDEITSARPGQNCIAVVPARIDRDGSAVPIDEKQRADGVLVIRQPQPPLGPKQLTFVPWSNVRGLVYG